MGEVTVADVVAFIGILALFGANLGQFILSSRSRGAEAHANEADAIESLTQSVKNLNADVRELQIQLDAERVARRLAESELNNLKREVRELQESNRQLKFENEALLTELSRLT